MTEKEVEAAVQQAHLVAPTVVLSALAKEERAFWDARFAYHWYLIGRCGPGTFTTPPDIPALSAFAAYHDLDERRKRFPPPQAP